MVESQGCQNEYGVKFQSLVCRSLWNTNTHFIYLIDTIAREILVKERVRPSAAMALSQLSRYKMVTTLKGLIDSKIYQAYDISPLQVIEDLGNVLDIFLQKRKTRKRRKSYIMGVIRSLSKLPYLQVLDEFCVGVGDTFVLTQFHYSDVIMTTIASQITSLTIVYSTVYLGVDQGKHQSSASLAFM